MIDRFSERARLVMGRARAQAQSWRHDYIGTEHILLGMLGMPRSSAVEVLSALDVDLEQLRSRIESRMERGTSEVTMGQVPFTSNMRSIFQTTLKESLRLGHSHIGTEHLIIALALPEGGIAADALSDVGADGSRLREGVLEVVGADIGPSPLLAGFMDDCWEPAEAVKLLRRFARLDPADDAHVGFPACMKVTGNNFDNAELIAEDFESEESELPGTAAYIWTLWSDAPPTREAMIEVCQEFLDASGES